MIYRSLEECVNDLERHGHLVRVAREVDPHLEMAAIQLEAFRRGGPALLFENVKGTKFRSVCNLFGTLERSRFIFRGRLDAMKRLVQLRNDPVSVLKKPLSWIGTGTEALRALPRRASFSRAGFREISISDLPLIRHWPLDGGAFVTLPQVYTEDPDRRGVMGSNLGMYRIQLDGNDYLKNREIGLHYQIHRGIGVHQAKWNKRGEAMKVSVFVGGPPSHTLAAVMPLPEGLSELTFAGALGGRRFRYDYVDGYCISLDADFVITGEVRPGDVKPEGPFGDHLGYYSLQHPFPVMRVHKVFANERGIWPFTVVGRPPQEDTAFGALIHEISGSAIPQEIPGVKEVHAVDAAGVHPLLLAVGSERYTPYLSERRPAELLTQANRILGTGQLSLAKYLVIAAGDGDLDCHDVSGFLKYVFERVDLTRDLHFYTRTTIDTLDYSGTGINEGSKLVIAACGPPLRDLASTIPDGLAGCGLRDLVMPLPGVVAATIEPFADYTSAKAEMEALSSRLAAFGDTLKGIAQVVLYDRHTFNRSNLVGDYLWITYTRSNPSHDVYGVGAFTQFKHWGCTGPMIIDARVKPHHAPPLEMDAGVEQRAAQLLDTLGIGASSRR